MSEQELNKKILERLRYHDNVGGVPTREQRQKKTAASLIKLFNQYKDVQ